MQFSEILMMVGCVAYIFLLWHNDKLNYFLQGNRKYVAILLPLLWSAWLINEFQNSYAVFVTLKISVTDNTVCLIFWKEVLSISTTILNILLIVGCKFKFSK